MKTISNDTVYIIAHLFQLVTDESGSFLKLPEQVLFGHARGAAGLEGYVHQSVQRSRHLRCQSIYVSSDQVHLEVVVGSRGGCV